MAFTPIGDFLVTYTDGETETARSNFLGLAEIERRWPGDTAPAVQALGVAVWHYLGCPGEDLDKWLARVHLIEDATPTEQVELQEVPSEPAAGVA